MNCPNSIPQRRTRWWRMTLAMALMGLAGLSTKAQTITTTFANNNGSSVVVFSIQNNSATASYVLTDIGSVSGFTGTGTARLYAKPATYGAAPGVAGAITAVNGWTDIGSNTALATTANTTGSGNTATTWISGMTYVIAPLSQVRFCLQHASAAGVASFGTTGGSIRYSTVGVQTCSFPGGDLSIEACANYAYGGTMASPANTPRGFIGFVTLMANSPCAGLPNPGNTTGPANACPSQAFTVGVQNNTSGSGVSYAWESDNGGGWTPFGTNASTQSVSQTVATSYRCTVTCAGNGSTTSNPLSVGMNGFLACYCIPTTTNGCGAGDHVTNVTLTAQTNPLNNSTGACISGGSYSNYLSFSPIPGVQQTTSVPISVSVNNGGTEFAGAWIDYDQSGVFDASEFITLVDADNVAPWVFNGTANIPGTALLGNTGFRVRSSYNAAIAAGSSCANYSYGETEDYTITITAPPACITPSAVAASNITATSADISWTCSGCTGTYYVEYGPVGFTPGTGASAGTGTIAAGSPFASSPMTISGLSGLTTYQVYVRQECAPGVFSTNSIVANFNTGCGAATCQYMARVGDIWGDGWDGSQWEVRQNGVLLATLAATGCGPQDIFFNVCEGATITLNWTVGGSFQDEKALQLFDAFGVLLYDYRGTSTSANCPAVNWTSSNNTPPGSFPGNMFTGTVSCTPPACTQPTGVAASNVTGTSADVNWACVSCTGVFYVEYGPAGFTPGTGATAGTGTLVPGGPFAGGPVSITGLSGSTAYSVAVRQECVPGVFSNNTVSNFSTGVDCASAPVIPCGTSTVMSVAAGAGQWNLGGAFCSPPGPGTSPFCTNGREQVWQFTAPNPGVYVLNTTATNSVYVDWFFKAAPSTCDQTGWTYIDDVIFGQQFNFSIPAAGTYYILADVEGTGAATQTFSIVCPLPCGTPQTVTATNVSSIGAQINWTCPSCTGSQFNVEYGLTGFVPGTGTVVTVASSPAVLTGLSSTTGYQAYVTQDCNNVGDSLSNASSVVNFTTLAPPPANDSCHQAILLTCGVTISGSNVAATADPYPSQANNIPATVQTGVWYQYIPSVTGEQVTLDLCASTLDTRVHVFRGPDCSSLLGMGGNDDSCGLNGWRSFYTFNALPGFTYWIAVDGFGGSTNSFTMTVSCGPLCNPTVANDLCQDSQLITMSPNCSPVGGNLACATSSNINPNCIGGLNTYPDAYYQFVATAPDAFVVLGGGTTLGFSIYNGTSCDITNLNQVWCSNTVTSGSPTLVTGLTTGNTYTLRVYQPAASAGSFTLCVQKLEISDDACAPIGLVCNDLRFGRTTGRLNNIPVGACPFNGAASTGGVNFFSYTALADEDVTFSTCGQTGFDTRLSVFEGACTSLACNVMNDDAPGCPGGSSEVRLRAVTGQTYTLMVHGVGAAEGNYQISVFCAGYCSITEANDRCANSVTVPVGIIGDGSLPSTETQVCAYADAPTGCSNAEMVQGVWYDFATTQNTLYDVYIAPNSVDPQYTAANMNMAVYAGACSGVGAASEVFCLSNCQGTVSLPPLTPNSNYRLLVYNGGSTAGGSFGLMVSRPGFNDGGIAQVVSPVGTVCGGQLDPQVWLKNHGEAPLTSATIISRVGGDIVQTYNWSGGPIARGDSILVSLPAINVDPGPDTYTAEVSTANGAADELAVNNSVTTNYTASGNRFVVSIRTDGHPEEISWFLHDADFTYFLFPAAYTDPNTLVTREYCVDASPNGPYGFSLTDGGGDGIVSPGGWSLSDGNGHTILEDDGAYLGNSPSLTPGSPAYSEHLLYLPVGPSHIASTECNIFNNLLNNKVFTTAVAGATNYQFEFSDPNAGFRRRRSVPRNWVYFNEMSPAGVAPILAGTTYFVRARADQGATGYEDDRFGGGCNMALAAVQPICTELISTPGPTLSCGVTKQFGGSDKVWAQPVLGATQYRFRFVNLGEGYTRNIIRTSYICLLSWVTNPLVNGSTYDVSVETFVNGVWSGYCGATCQVTILNPPSMMQQGAGRVSEVENTVGMNMWPNPVRDGRVNLTINELETEIENVNVEVYDAFGKLVYSEMPVASGNSFNHVLNLGAQVAPGMYTVNVTINDKVYTERLSIQ